MLKGLEYFWRKSEILTEIEILKLLGRDFIFQSIVHQRLSRTPPPDRHGKSESRCWVEEGTHRDSSSPQPYGGA